MKLYAQHGFQEGNKIQLAITKDLIDGVIYSPRDIALTKLREEVESLKASHPSHERLVDPQYYATFLNDTENARLGNLLDDYGAYFRARRRSQLEREAAIRADLDLAIQFQLELKVTRVISPNILISNSLDSVEAVISKNFIRCAGEQFRKLKDPRPLLVTLAISRDALLDRNALTDFLNEITALEHPPGGFYVLIGGRSSDARTEIYNTDVIAAWMFINHVLSINGFYVINGYSDILTPFLGAVGGSAGALGWWSNLRTFSLDRFSPAMGGGRLPLPRYLSNALLNRITHIELDQLRKNIPAVLNGLPTDDLYDKDAGSAPERSLEVLQSWEAVKRLNGSIIDNEISSSLRNCRHAIQRAIEVYDTIPIRLDAKSNSDHLQALDEGTRLFERLAEL
ncbi:MAG: hypothetical protein JNJ88_16345 [Planctomycetes bacterium]|nr:hypothetical protein [Planctomycetota bacterium]